MNKKIGFIGAGNMAYAMCKGMIESKEYKGEDIIFSDISTDNLKKVYNDFKTKTSSSNLIVAHEVDILILAVKPHIYPSVINEIKDVIKKDVLIISIAAGMDINRVQELFEKPQRIIRFMPNTPAMVLEGMTGIFHEKDALEADILEATHIASSFGKYVILDEKYIHGIISMSGSSPAYMYMMLEAMGDFGVSTGISRKDSYILAAQSMLGAAKMVLETGLHPGQLKDMVCSPGGTTIEAVKKLEEAGLRSSLIKGMEAAYKKSQEM